MAVDSKQQRERWKNRQKAERKERGKDVKVRGNAASTGDSEADWIRVLRNAALREVVNALPGRLRAQFDGQEEHADTFDHKGVRIRVSLTHKQSDYVCNEAIVVANDTINRHKTSDAERFGIVLGIALHQAISRWDANRKDHHANDEYEQQAMKEPATTLLSEAVDSVIIKSAKKAARPACKLCGKEDTSKFPDWGPCPHEATS